MNMRSPEQQCKAPKTPKDSVEKIPIVETETTVSYLGVTLEKAGNSEGQFVPRKEKYADFFNDPDFAIPFQKDLAI